jgi:hypothetical protein
MLQITHTEIFEGVIERAKHATGGESRWINAINRAVREIDSNPYMHWQGTAMLIQSSTSDEIYTANGTCQCRAYELHQACWHRASARLWRRYLEAVNACKWQSRRAA